MHTHHSHSGKYCQHAKDSLEDVVKTAIDKKFSLICLTEHIPRLVVEQLYPEELESQTTPKDLQATFEAYYQEAHLLKEKYSSQIKILVGFEAEGLDLPYVESLVKTHNFDMFVGSLHHVDEIPIDFDQQKWDLACSKAGDRDSLFGRYFDQQYDMIKALKPTVIGHFDLIRLFSPDHSISATNWHKVERNVDLAISLGCLFEINTSAIRKGWDTPYPQKDIADLIKSKNGKFCLSDDSHGVAQVGLNYHKINGYLEEYGPLASADGTVLYAKDVQNWLK